ncbi:twitching motility protein [Thermotoga sp. RQ7]|uniref:type IV pilus twitching motility protein PilT n=1 Tax=Thermotoga sp. RQ7 TaxID=126738 RepID=UPI0005A358DE|nr:type IV pilus twitching motility protein PilT [Thermotoga sp. RQ7]AJG41315.1 twitching motility protein [Thermotoga sp. RQ7]MDK2785875.1 twitching motility protein PilT [Thermotoga sp.]MDK2950175.1 twitching motility protein PilT [Thermotoga sp.]
MTDKSFLKIITEAYGLRATDVHISAGCPPYYRIDGKLVPQEKYGKFSREDVMNSLKELFLEIGHPFPPKEKEVDFSFTVGDAIRVRGNLYYERKNPAVAFRLIPKKIRTFQELGLPEILKTFVERKYGLILVAGPTGSGKSTTLAAMIDHINENFPYHIITIEDPIEYVFTNKKSVIHQRELGSDTDSFYNGLKYALRQDPDVILVGEMRDLETMALALTAAETGHLVLATVHTNSAASAPERIIDVFPAHQQRQIALQLANTLIAVIYQRLVPKANGIGFTPIVEIMVGTPAVRNLIRENKIHQLESVIQAGARHGMILFDDALVKAALRGDISREDAIQFARNQEEVARRLGVKV